MAEAATWQIAQEHLAESVKELRKYVDEEGASVLVKLGNDWVPLLEVDAEHAQEQGWEGVADGICIEGDCSTTLSNLEGVKPGDVWLGHDEGVDGLVLYIGSRAVLAIAGEGLESLPEGLIHLEAANLSARALEAVAASSGGRALRGLDVGGSDALCEEVRPAFVESFPQLQELSLSDFEQLEDLGPVGELAELRSLNLDGCCALKDLGPLAKLSHLRSLDLSGCDALADLSPLADLPICELSLSECERLPDLAPLVRILALTNLDLSDCANLQSVAALRACAELQELVLTGCPNVTDLHVLSDCTSLRGLEVEDTVTAALILAACAVKRVDADYVQANVASWMEQLELAQSPAEFVEGMLPALALGGDAAWAVDALEDLVERSVRAGISERSTWQLLFDRLLAVGDPACRRGMEIALEGLTPGSDPAPIVGPGLDVLSRLPDSATGWAHRLADTTLDPLATTPRATAVAAAAVRFYAKKGHAKSLEPWLDLVTQSKHTSEPPRSKPKREALPSLEDDPAALAAVVARTVQKQPDSPAVAQLVAALVGLARERPDAHTVEPFVDHFVLLFQTRSESIAVGRLCEAASNAAAEQPHSTPSTTLGDRVVTLIRTQPDHPIAQKAVTAIVSLWTDQPDSPAVAQLTTMVDAARDAGVGVFARSVLDHPTLRDKADPAAIEEFANSFDGREARRAMIRGLVDKLCSEDVLRNKPRAAVIAALEAALVDVD